MCRLALYIYLHVSTWKPIWASAAAAGPAGDWDYPATARENRTSSDSFMLCSSLPDPLILCMCQWWSFLVSLMCRTWASQCIHPLADKTCFWSHSRDQSLPFCPCVSYPPPPWLIPQNSSLMQPKLQLLGHSRRIYCTSSVLGTS